MKIKITRYNHTDYGLKRWELDGDGISLSLGKGEPEDMIIGRDLFSYEEMVKLIELSMEAGRLGEGFEIEFDDIETKYWD